MTHKLDKITEAVTPFIKAEFEKGRYIPPSEKFLSNPELVHLLTETAKEHGLNKIEEIIRTVLSNQKKINEACEYHIEQFISNLRGHISIIIK